SIIHVSFHIFFFFHYGYHRVLLSFPTRRSSDLQSSLRKLNPSSFSFNLISSSDLRPKLRTFIMSSSLFVESSWTVLIPARFRQRSEEHTSELQSRFDLVCRLLLEKKILREFKLI